MNIQITKTTLKIEKFLKVNYNWRNFYGEFKQPKSIQSSSGLQLDNITHFKLKLPFLDRSITEEWDSAGVEYTFKEESIDWTGYLLNMLPWILLIGFGFL